ncbi:Coatomer subunit zeta [Cucumispora dikerogammari]|nr:Coatomer subunit zeta [Cucumispora dikerogammari]
MLDKIYSLEIYGEFGIEIYKSNYNSSPISIDLNAILLNTNNLQYYTDSLNTTVLTVFKLQADEITVLLKCGDVNEIFISQSLEVFCEVLRHIVKKELTKDSIIKNYDLLCILVDNYILNGIIRENEFDKLYEKIPKRGFEIEGMKMSKGFSSFFSSFSNKK